MAGAGHHLLNTSAGPLDVLGTIAGGRDYEILLPHTVELMLDETTGIRILDLETLTYQAGDRTRYRQTGSSDPPTNAGRDQAGVR